MTGKRRLSILDVTIRDGSYVINYQYTPEQVANIAGALDAAGIDYIEVSHGCGLGARENLGMPAAASDLEYVRAAKKAVKHAKIGVIASPPPGTQPKDIDAVIEHVDFIRFAANVDNPRVVESNIVYTQKLRKNVRIFFQLMRCTRRKKEAILSAARQVEGMGVDIIYVVDTAGRFLQVEVDDIISTLAARLKIDIGFHGHNNLGMAIANTLSAIDAGARAVDASLKGIGRAGGNAQLEALVSILKRGGLARQVDLGTLIHAGEAFVAPIMPPERGISAIDLITADANIDLYPLKIYERVAGVAKIDLIDLIYTLAADESTVEVDIEAIRRALKKLRADAETVLETVGLKKRLLRYPLIQGRPPRKKKLPPKTAVLALKMPVDTYNFPDEMAEMIAKRFPEVCFHVTSFNPEHIEKIEEAEILFSYLINERLLMAAKRLKWFHSAFIGAEIYNFPLLIKSKVIVTTPRGFYSITVSESALAMMLAHVRGLKACITEQPKGKWAASAVLSSEHPLSELQSSTVIIIGLGGIGTALAQKCSCLGMHVIGVVPTARPRPVCVDNLVVTKKLPDVLPLADFVVITCPLTAETRGLIGRNELSIMKETAFLINVARGPVVDEDALLEALKNGKVGGAGLDVFVSEPLPDGHPLYSAPNTIITPHIAGVSIHYWERAVASFAENLRRYLDGAPLHGVVDFKRGY